MIRTIVDAFRNWGWSLDYLTHQKRSEPHMYANMGRFREASQLTVDDDQRWGRYLKDSDNQNSL